MLLIICFYLFKIRESKSLTGSYRNWNNYDFSNLWDVCNYDGREGKKKRINFPTVAITNVVDGILFPVPGDKYAFRSNISGEISWSLSFVEQRV